MHWWHSYQISEKQTLKWFQAVVMTKVAAKIRSLTLNQNFQRRKEKQISSVCLDFGLKILEMLTTLQYSVQSYGKITIVIYRKWDHLLIFWNRGKNFPRQHLSVLLHPWGRSTKHFDELYTQHCWWCPRKATEAKSNTVNLEVQLSGWKFPLQSLRVSWYLIYQVQVFCFYK